ncbi:hypothetical protein [Pseudomonas fulva]|uniref:hypothetical protein n=1 Tax=Pseudomonas fulva TaxID=47880 RepID=UPI0018A919D7|nr:hypothetical protein [Pseudomonas fulva]MBF8679896.1 hypothetical protein [Pseudomonas fulva]MBF8717633.1 hypothetical protein [Pseudomonas fulva]MBF8784699.1 hypothetical protein [Pseudomonas fulva]
MNNKFSNFISVLALLVSATALYYSTREVDSVVIAAIDYDNTSHDDRIVTKLAFSNSGNRTFFISSVDSLVSNDGVEGVSAYDSSLEVPKIKPFALGKDQIESVELNIPRSQLRSDFEGRTPFYLAANITAVDVDGNKVNETFWYASFCVSGKDIIRSNMPRGYARIGSGKSADSSVKDNDPCI